MGVAIKPGRIALFFHDLGIGGAEQVMLQLARGFMDAGHPVDLVLASAEGPFLSEVPVKARIIDFKTRNPLTMFIRLVKYLRTEKPKALLSPFEVTSVIAVAAKKITGTPTKIAVRISTHLSKNKRTRLKKIIERIVVSRVYPFADVVITVSRGVAEDLAVYTGIPPERINIIYSPIDVDRMLRAAEQPVDHPFFASGQYPIILGVGRLSEEKDFPTLLRAFDMVRKEIESRLIILGDGEKRQALEEMVRSNDLQDVVDLLGFDLNPFRYMKNASVFVLSSKWEGLPGALIQALACGCPVVSMDCQSGPSEILNGGQYGHLVPVGNADALAKAIVSVLNGDVRRPPETWLEQFGMSTIIEQYREVLCR